MMKLLFVFLLVGAVSCNTDDGTAGTRFMSKDPKVRNYHLVRLLNNIFMPNVNPDQRKIGSEWNFRDNTENFLNPKALTEFRHYFEIGMLPINTVFALSNDRQRDEAVALFHLFYYAKDFETFYRVACWARMNLNEGQFVYALTVAVLHRQDCRGFVLPPPYEIYPHFFINSEMLKKGTRIKIQNGVIDRKLAGLYGIHFDDNNFVYIESNYTDPFVNLNEETKISYFTDDIGLNTYYYYFNALYPFWMSGDEYGFDKQMRGEMWLYLHQQLLARYYMERLSQGIGRIPNFSWYTPIKTGYKCNLEFLNGLKCPSRSNFYDLLNSDTYYELDDIKDSERVIRDVARTGRVTADDGTVINLKDERDIYYLGNLIQGNKDCVKNKFWRHIILLAKTVLGGGEKSVDDHLTVPTALEQFQTALRDPMFYQLYKKYVRYAMRFKEMLPRYTRADLVYPGIKINNVEVDKLVTFTDSFNVDMTNAFYRTLDEFHANKEGLKFIACLNRLNHKRFTVTLDIASERTTNVVIKLFLGPKHDHLNRRIPLHENRENFFEIDTFVHPLKTGKNVIARDSRDFTVTVGDWTSTRDMLKTERDFAETKATFDYVGFPDRLVLPRGKTGGMEFQLFAMVVPTHVMRDVVREPTRDVAVENMIDKRDDSMTRFRLIKQGFFGYPFDRRVRDEDFLCDNMYMRDVVIDHLKDDDINRVRFDERKMYEKSVMRANDIF